MSTVDSELADFLAATELFSSLGKASRQAIADSLEVRSIASGVVLIEDGGHPGGLYLILSGVLAATARDDDGGYRFLTALVAGSAAGGWSLVTGDASQVRVSVMQDASVARLSREGFEDFARRFPEDAQLLTEAIIRDQRRARLQLALYSSNLFGDLEGVPLRDLEQELELHTFIGGEVVLREGDPSDCLYVVLSGRLRVVRSEDGGQERLVSELAAGDIAGEMGLITGEPRSATVYAIRDTVAARLSREGFDHFVGKHPHQAMYVFSRKMAQRLNGQLAGGAPPVRAIRTVAVFPAGRDLPVSEFSSRLANALSALGPALHLSSGSVDRALGREGISQVPDAGTRAPQLVEWLNQQEAEHRFVVYECDAWFTAWTARASRLADRIVLLGDATQDPAPGEAERKLTAGHASTGSAACLLALLHRDGVRPSGTAKWLRGRKVERHHHVRLGSPGDFGRLARFLVERAFGLTLGGGFARAMTHCGVLRALIELGVEIDAIGGNSMGALLAAEWAQGWTPEEMLERTARRCSACLKDMTLPLVAFKSGGKFASVVRDFNGDTQIEDLWYPYYCVSTNLNRAELKIHAEGALSKAILASTRVPGVFPPIVYDGELHVDGGLLNNVPVDIMRGIVGGGLVMGVDAVPARQFSTIPDYGADLRGWNVLWDQLSPFKRSMQIPSIILIMLRTMELGGVSRKQSLAETADLYLRPPLQGVKPTDFAQAREIAALGYRSAREAVVRWMESSEMSEARKPLARQKGAS